MEKQSSRNSQDNCPPVIFFFPLLSLFTLLCFFICSFCIQSCFFPSLLFLESLSDSKAFFGKKKRKTGENKFLTAFFFPTHTEGSQDNHFGLCWFSRNVNLTHRLSQCLRKTRNLSRFLARCCRCHRFCEALREGQKQEGGRKCFPILGLRLAGAGVVRKSRGHLKNWTETGNADKGGAAPVKSSPAEKRKRAGWTLPFVKFP